MYKVSVTNAMPELTGFKARMIRLMQEGGHLVRGRKRTFQYEIDSL